jgi:hypothetical protein
MPVFSTSARMSFVGLRVSRALAENDERLLRALEQVERALHGVGAGICAGPRRSP